MILDSWNGQNGWNDFIGQKVWGPCWSLKIVTWMWYNKSLTQSLLKKIITTEDHKIFPLILMVLWSGKRVESVREKKSDLSSLSMTIYKATVLLKLEMNNFLNSLGWNGSKWRSWNGRNDFIGQKYRGTFSDHQK